MSDTTTAITPRPPEEKTTLRTQYELKLEQSRARLREAMAVVKVRARELTPAARINENPTRWILGGLVLGLAAGWLTAGRRR
ncbi:MAG: hypothetical protein H0V89_03125 [Deltaproteobacteria bacterium]|nr:hypothetical protein [Deltaproteobacteria bacterium]